MKSVSTFFLLLIVMTGRSQELTADASTLLLLHFNNSVNGASGETPVTSSNISYGSGRFGQALQCNGNTLIKFDTTANLNRYKGTIEFWIKPENFAGAGYIFDYDYINGILIEIGYWTGISINKNPDIGLTWPELAWFPNTWYHLAFTWGDGELKMYLNGRFITKKTYNIPLSPIPLTQFTVGAPSFGSGGFKGLIDEFRISNIQRTENELCNDYLKGWGTIDSVEVTSGAITMYKGWNVYLNYTDGFETPKIIAINGTDTMKVGAGCIDWTVSDPAVLQIDNTNLTLMAIGGGTASLNGSVAGKTFSIPVTVKLPVLPEERVQNIDPFLAQPAACYTNLIPTVAYIYLPTLDGINIDLNEVSNVPQTIALVKQRMLETLKFTKFSLEEGSKFRGYQNPNAKPFVGYKVIEYVFIYEPIPRGKKSHAPGWHADFNVIMNRFNGKKNVDTLGVKEVWLVGYDIDVISAVESNMSSPTTGDISNSLRWQDDLPVYNNTYIVYNYNMQRAGNEAVHNHGHQFESMIDYVDQKQNGNNILSFQKFRGYTPGITGPLGRVGDTHHPPNTRVDYDYCNTTLVASDIFDWKPEGGTTTMVNCNSWSSIPYQWPAGVSHDANSNFFILWMQSFMGNGNQIQYGSRWMTNWWRFMSDWDSNTVKIGLHQANQEINQGCIAAINTSLTVTSVCSGGSFSVNYYGNGVVFNAGNVFTAQLSDATGNFTNLINIGTASSTSVNGLISVTLPTNASSGNSYLIRVNSSNPIITGSGLSLLSIKSLPPAAIISPGSAISFCAGGSVTLTSNAANGNQWYKDGVVISGATATTYIANASGNYTAKVTVNGCESAASNAIVVTVNAIPATPTITQSGNDLVSSAVSGNQWYINNVIIAGATGKNYTPTTSGNYTVQVTLNNCTSTFSNVFNFIVTNIPNIDVFGNQVKIFPNPVNDKLVITRSNTLTGLNIRLFDINGKELKTISSGSSRIEIEMATYAGGAYIIWIEDWRNKIRGRKIIVKL